MVEEVLEEKVDIHFVNDIAFTAKVVKMKLSWQKIKFSGYGGNVVGRTNRRGRPKRFTWRGTRK